MLSRQVIGLLFRTFLVGILFLSSNSWAMNPPKKEQPIQKLTLAHFPPDVLVFGIYRNFLSPLDWARASGVNRHWYRSFNNILLWQPVGWAGLVNPHPTNDKKAVEILNDLFKSPNLAKLFSIPTNPALSLETLPWRCYKKEPTDEGKPIVARELYLIKYWNNSRKAKKTLFLKNSDRENCANARQTKLKNTIIPALKDFKYYHPEILWKIANILSPGARHYIRQGENYIGLGDFLFQNIVYLDKSYIYLDKNYLYLDAALAGHSKARAKIVYILLEGLQGLVLKRQENRKQELKLYFNQLRELAQIWPEGRAHLLRHEFSSNASTKKDPNAQFHIGDGKETTLALGLPLPITWPEAHLTEGESFYDRCKKSSFELERVHAQNLFEEAYKQGAVGSLLAYVKSLKPIPENLELFQSLSADLENLEPSKRSSETSEILGTVYLKLCQIKLSAIPENAGDNDPTIGEFLTVFKQGYETLWRHNGFLPTYGHNHPIDEFLYNSQNGEFQPPNYSIKREYHLLSAVAQSLPQDAKNQSVRYAFIDWNIKELPSYCTTGWIKGEIKGYLKNKWGETFLQEGKVGNARRWNERDTAYANVFFSSCPSRTVRAKFYATLMRIALQRKEKTFSSAFESYCHNLKNDKLGVTHCELLDKNLSGFRKKFPGNTALPYIFGQFVLEQKQWTKKTNRTPWQEKAMEYLAIAATNGSQKAIEYYKTLATNGSQKAIDFFQKCADSGSEDAWDFLVSLVSMENNESSSEDDYVFENACNFLVSLSSKRKKEYISEKEPPTKRRKPSGGRQGEDN